MKTRIRPVTGAADVRGIRCFCDEKQKQQKLFLRISKKEQINIRMPLILLDADNSS